MIISILMKSDIQLQTIPHFNFSHIYMYINPQHFSIRNIEIINIIKRKGTGKRLENVSEATYSLKQCSLYAKAIEI